VKLPGLRAALKAYDGWKLHTGIGWVGDADTGAYETEYIAAKEFAGYWPNTHIKVRVAGTDASKVLHEIDILEKQL
jgi:hypothetical protein